MVKMALSISDADRATSRPRRCEPAVSGGAKAVAAAADHDHRRRIADDLRLFALTFAGGFLFMTVFLA